MIPFLVRKRNPQSPQSGLLSHCISNSSSQCVFPLKSHPNPNPQVKPFIFLLS